LSNTQPKARKAAKTFFLESNTILCQNNDKHLRNTIQRKIKQTVAKIRRDWLQSLNCKELYDLTKFLSKGEHSSILPNIEEANVLNEFFTRFNKDLHKDSNTSLSSDPILLTPLIILPLRQ